MEEDEKEHKEVDNNENQKYTKGTVSRERWKEILNKAE